VGFCRFSRAPGHRAVPGGMAKSIFIMMIVETETISTRLANGVHLPSVIHDFGFPGWPELNLD